MSARNGMGQSVDMKLARNRDVILSWHWAAWPDLWVL